MSPPPALSVDVEQVRSDPTVTSAGPSAHPPRPQLAFHVGVVGHRPDRLARADLPALSRVLRGILIAVKSAVTEFADRHPELCPDQPPVLRAISPLAEGSDRLLAEQAVDLGFELCCPMPFAQAEFEQDFAPDNALERDSVRRFHSLLQRAEEETALTVFELDGRRENPGAAYGAAGSVVLNQSDLVVVVWDGQRLGQSGGTEETLAAARRRDVPVVWIDARAPHSWQLLDRTSPMPHSTSDEPALPAPTGIERVQEAVREILAVPGELTAGGQITLQDYYRESKPRFSPAVLWKLFRDLVGDSRWSFAGLAIPDFEAAVESGWPRDHSTAPKRVVDRLRGFYAWPDQLAVCYSDSYRSAFILVYLLAAGAVGMALLPIAAGWFDGQHHWGERACIVLELLLILCIITVVYTGRRRRWHERWLDYRLAAEMIRHLRLVLPLGGGRPFPRLSPHHASYGHPGWVTWYVRAVERAAGLPTAHIDRDHLGQCLADVRQLLDEQVDFHRKNAARCGRIEKRLHWLGLWLLGLTLLAGGLHLIPQLAEATPLPGVLTFLCGFMPALGAALVGINNQGEFRRLAKRSEAMHGQLAALQERAAALQGRLAETDRPAHWPSSAEAGAVAEQAAQLMIAEVLDWRVVFLDRPLNPPT